MGKVRLLIKAVILIIILILFVTGTGCKFDLKKIIGVNSYSDDEDSSGDTNYSDFKSSESKKSENILPAAVIRVYQKNSSGDYFKIGNPVYFSAAESADADGDSLSFQWYIEGAGLITGEEISYIFNSTGDYLIKLTANDGSDTVTVSKRIQVVEFTENILVTAEHELTVSIEYIIKNNGPVSIEDIICLIQIPQTYQPFQIIKDCRYNYSKEDYIYSDDYNLIARFNLGDLEAGETARAYVSCDTVLSEYEFIRTEENLYGNFDAGDKDLSLFTEPEYYIDSGSRQVESIVRNIIGKEVRPLLIAEKLYNYVVNRMVYDEKKLSEGLTTYEYASDILQKRKGICTDYSILYIALCRAAGIPAKFVQGIPAFSILMEESRSIPYGHAWVEIKLPGYGWIPVDITAENEFMGYNYSLNVETYKGSGAFFRSISVDGVNCYPDGFYYSWNGNAEPDITRDMVYRVSGINPLDISVVSENKFLERVSRILSDYSAAINHVSSVHTEDWIFNDPEEIAVEETFLVRLLELSKELEEANYPESYAADRNNLVEISYEINLHKDRQIKCMKSNDYECSMNEYTLFVNSLTELFDYYANMVERFNKKY